MNWDMMNSVRDMIVLAVRLDDSSDQNGEAENRIE